MTGSDREPLDLELRRAVRHFWRTRTRQSAAQDARGADRDRGARSAVTGGAHMDGFVDLSHKLLVKAGIRRADIYRRRRVELPGWFRAEKKWDLVVVIEGRLFAAIEFKAQVGPSFGNNYNNRSEEALGNATDWWAAYREGAFAGSPRPWLGYLMLLENAPGSTRPVGVSEPHFPVFEPFRGASYAGRYELLLTRMVRERLYDAACLLMSPCTAVRSGAWTEPAAELSFVNFAESLVARALAFSRTRR